jgi:class 3 adenylate cyclase
MSETPEADQIPDDAETADVKYFFLDIVGYTRNRSVEAQVHVVQKLNEAVLGALKSTKEQNREVILLPTGDGMAVAFISAGSYDIHLRTALEVIKNIAGYNQTTRNDPTRQFEVRIGVNENTDNVVLDINGNRNVAGNGIAMAQRIMDKADGMQVLVSESVHIKLSPRERYMKSFRRFAATGKHALAFPVFQYVSEAAGLNINSPSVFGGKTSQSPKFSHVVAYYIAEAAIQKQFFIERKEDGMREDAATVLLFYRAEDRVATALAKEHQDSPCIKAWGEGKKSFEEQYQHYSHFEFWPLLDLREFLTDKYLRPYEKYFNVSGPAENCLIFPTAAGIAKLKVEWPTIARDFGIMTEKFFVVSPADDRRDVDNR